MSNLDSKLFEDVVIVKEHVVFSVECPNCSNILASFSGNIKNIKMVCPVCRTMLNRHHVIGDVVA